MNNTVNATSQPNIQSGPTASGSHSNSTPSPSAPSNQNNAQSQQHVNQLPISAGQANPSSAQPPPSSLSQPSRTDREKIYNWIIELASPESRENSLLELR